MTQGVADPAGAVSPELFATAKSYDEYIASITHNREKFADNLAKTKVPDELAARYRALLEGPDGPVKVLVIGEDWCPDVFRGLPVMQRIAQSAGMELRVLERDQNMEVMQHFRNGDFDSIPVFIFFTRDHRYLAHWIERPAGANTEMRDALSPIFGPSGTRQLTERLGREPTEGEKAEAKAETARQYEEFQRSSPYWARWRDYTVQEVLELLERARGA
ncbi:MAG: thioredoxin family protein [Dehalococcoidia bacterium]